MNQLTGQVGGFGSTNAAATGPAVYGGMGTQSQQYGPDQEEIAKINAQAAEYPATLRNQHFQQLFPLLSNALSSTGSLTNPVTPGGVSATGGPAINAGPVWNPQQIQQQVNASRAQTDAATQTQQRASADQAAGRGFSSQSPLTLALQGQEAGQGLATKAANQNQIQWGAAQGNADQTLKGQQAREQQFASRQNEDIARRQPFFQQQNALISALGGMI